MLWLPHDIKDQSLLDWWEEVRWFHESRFSLAVKNMVRSSQWECRNVLLEKCKFDAWVYVLVDLGQCGVISSCKETFGGHLKRIHFAVVITDVSCEMCIFVGFLSVPLLNILLRGTWELKQVDGFFLVVQNHYVWFQGGNTKLRWNWPPPEAVCPGRSLKTLNFGSTFVTI